MAAVTLKIKKKQVKQSELPKKKYKARSALHVFAESKIPLSASVAQKAPEIFNLTA